MRGTIIFHKILGLTFSYTNSRTASLDYISTIIRNTIKTPWTVDRMLLSQEMHSSKEMSHDKSIAKRDIVWYLNISFLSTANDK